MSTGKRKKDKYNPKSRRLKKPACGGKFTRIAPAEPDEAEVARIIRGIEEERSRDAEAAACIGVGRVRARKPSELLGGTCFAQELGGICSTQELGQGVMSAVSRWVLYDEEHEVGAQVHVGSLGRSSLIQAVWLDVKDLNQILDEWTNAVLRLLVDGQTVKTWKVEEMQFAFCNHLGHLMEAPAIKLEPGAIFKFVLGHEDAKPCTVHVSRLVDEPVGC